MHGDICGLINTMDHTLYALLLKYLVLYWLHLYYTND
jgi:hypothetical protein